MADYDDVNWESGDDNGGHEHEIKAIDEPLVIRGKKKAPPGPKKVKVNFQADDYEICLLRHQIDLERNIKGIISVSSSLNTSDFVGSELFVLLPANLSVLSQQSNKNLADVVDIASWFRSTFKHNEKEVIVLDKKRKYKHPLQQIIDNKTGTLAELRNLFMQLLNTLNFSLRFVSTANPQSYSPQDHEDICQSRKEFQEKAAVVSSSSGEQSSQPINLIEEETSSSRSQKAKKETDSLQWIEVLVLAPDVASKSGTILDEKDTGKTTKGKKKGTEAAAPSGSSSMQSASSSSSDQLRWVHVDIAHKLFDQPEEVEKSLLGGNNHINYVLAVETQTGHLVDVTVRYKYTYPHMRVQDKHSQDYMSNWLKNYIAQHNERCDAGEVPGVIDLSEDVTGSGSSSSSSSSSSRYKKTGKAVTSPQLVDSALRHKLAVQREREVKELALLQERKLSVLPQSYKDFKDHPVYLLERHLLSDQMLHPTEKKVVAQFKGEDVYLQRHKEKCRSFIQWRREARLVRRGEEPAKVITRLKMPGRNNKGKTAAENDEEQGMDGNYAFDLVDDGGGKTVDIKLYGRWQTDPLCADPIVDGRIPMNEFGNIEVWDGKDVFVPEGAVFLEGSAAIKAAKNLDIHHVPALTGFEARKGGKFNVPVIGGVVVLREHEQLVREAATQLEAAAEEKWLEKREKAIAEKWKKLVVGVLGRQQLRDKYGH